MTCSDTAVFKDTGKRMGMDMKVSNKHDAGPQIQSWTWVYEDEISTGVKSSSKHIEHVFLCFNQEDLYGTQ